MFRFISIICFILVSQGCFAQKNYTTEKTAKKKQLESFRKGQRLFFNGQYAASLQEFEKLLRNDPTFIDAHIERANVKNQLGLFSEAEKGYETTLSIDPGYIPGVLYSLAIVEYDQEKFAEASQHFEAYLNSGKVSPKRKINAEAYLRSAKFADHALKNPVPFNPVNMGPAINTPNHEYLPTLTADGEKLIYTAVRHQQEDFFLSQKSDSVWQPGQPIASVNSQYNEGAQSISADGKLLVFTICNKPGSLGRCDLYFTELLNSEWTQVKNMGSPINSAAYESLPSVSADGKELFFTSDRKGGKGKLDLWVSYRQKDGAWGQPKNLGLPINTALDEQAPFIHPDGQTLYFMSKGHPGMGKYDLFLSRRMEDGNWGEPQNLGHPINTKENEGAFSVSLDGSTAYFASDMEGGMGKNDIYTFELHKAARPKPVTYVKAVVSDADTGENLSASVEFINLKSGQVYASSITDQSGEFLVTLPAGSDFALHVLKEKYLFHSENFALEEQANVDKPFLLDIKLHRIPENVSSGDLSAPIILKNVFFETSSAELKKESLAELSYLKKLLEENIYLKIQINGHTDNIGSNEDNLKLSELRAKAVHDYLIENNIGPDRLSFKGFGEATPIANNDSEEGRKQNRRTEFMIVQ